MSITLGGGPLKPLSKFARELGLHVATLGRWRNPGIIGPEGERERFGALRVGGRWMSTDAELDRFLGILNAGRGIATSAGTRSPAARSKGAAAAARELDRIGI